jgi:hypothetical protein
MMVIENPPLKKLVLDHSQTIIDNGQEGGKGWAEKLRTQADGNKIGTFLFSLSFYFAEDLT